jgi:hypothetical protein
VHTGVAAARQAPSQGSSENLEKREMALVSYGSSDGLLDIRTQAPLFLDVAKYLLGTMEPTKLE